MVRRQIITARMAEPEGAILRLAKLPWNAAKPQNKNSPLFACST